MAADAAKLELEQIMSTMAEAEWRNVRILEHYQESHIAYSLIGVKIADGKTYYYQAETGRFVRLNI